MVQLVENRLPVAWVKPVQYIRYSIRKKKFLPATASRKLDDNVFVVKLDPEPYLRITAPATDLYYFIKDLKTFYRKSHGSINLRKKVQK